MYVNWHIRRGRLHTRGARIALNRGVKRSSPEGYILIVESDDLVRALLEGWLREAGYAVAIAGAAAAVAGPLRLVIADIASPRGADASIRALKSAHRAPILAISARFRCGLEGSAEAARRMGVSNVLPKPFTRRALLDAVRTSLCPLT